MRRRLREAERLRFVRAVSVRLWWAGRSGEIRALTEDDPAASSKSGSFIVDG